MQEINAFFGITAFVEKSARAFLFCYWLVAKYPNWWFYLLINLLK